jgi:hypothetical protein
MSPAEIDAAWPTTAARSRLPQAFTVRTAKTAVLVMKGHPLDRADKGLTRRRRGKNEASVDSIYKSQHNIRASIAKSGR